MKRLWLSSFYLLLASGTIAQDRVYAVRMVDTLTSTYFWGRGYTKGGMDKASRFLEQELKGMGVSPMAADGFFQHFSYPVNTFPGNMQVFVNGRELEAGRDYIITPESRGQSLCTRLEARDSTHFAGRKGLVNVELKEKLTWSVAPSAAACTRIQVDNKRVSPPLRRIRIKIDNEEIKEFRASNVCGMVKGTLHPDSLIIFSAHYDHLGGMGRDVYFPGANDNASGTSFLLSLARYYAQHPQPYSMGFLFFAGEEAGLKGSAYFTEHPLVPLRSIRFLVNLDLVGTGEEGATVVNATEFPAQFGILTSINADNGYLAKLKPRGKAANSDHYWFTEKKVPAFFIYTMGGPQAYHDIFDRAATLPYTKYEELFGLLLKFASRLM